MKRTITIGIALLFLLQPLVPAAQGYILNHTIPASGGCPQLNHFNTATAGIADRRWSTSLGTSPQNVITTATDTTGRLNEIEDGVQNSFSVWTSVSGTTLTPAALATLNRTDVQNACTSTDGLNTICFNQSDSGFSAGVLAFTRVVTSDILGEKPFPNSPASAFIGEILDADVLFKPGDSNTCFATRSALATATCGNSSKAFDLESVLIHELGHFFGFSHAGVWRAIMWPFAPPRGTFLGDRPSTQVPDAPLGDDDRTGLRVLYPSSGDTVNVGSISGFIKPANTLSLASLPETSPGRKVTGIFGAHVVAADADTGAVMAATLGGWSCDPNNLPTTFDGFYIIERLPVGKKYKVFVEPLDGPAESGDVSGATADLCRQDVPKPCKEPQVNIAFTTKVRP